MVRGDFLLSKSSSQTRITPSRSFSRSTLPPESTEASKLSTCTCFGQGKKGSTLHGGKSGSLYAKVVEKDGRPGGIRTGAGLLALLTVIYL
jgi:hypothetical protein